MLAMFIAMSERNVHVVAAPALGEPHVRPVEPLGRLAHGDPCLPEQPRPPGRMHSSLSCSVGSALSIGASPRSRGGQVATTSSVEGSTGVTPKAPSPTATSRPASAGPALYRWAAAATRHSRPRAARAAGCPGGSGARRITRAARRAAARRARRRRGRTARARFIRLAAVNK